MSWHTEQLKTALGLGGLVSFYGIVSLLVVLFGDRFGAGTTEKIIIVALVLLTLPFALLIAWWTTRKSKKTAENTVPNAENNAVTNVGEPPSDTNLTAKPTGNYAELNASADEAFAFLKSSQLGGGKNSAGAVYGLPLFVVAGSPRSGKTSLAVSAGFDTQTFGGQRQSEQNLIRPTRFADFRISTEAVVLDTAGRYQTEADADRDEWAALIETLKKHRPQRPLDGYIVAVNAARLLETDDAEIEAQAKTLRSRLDETMARSKTIFPVYLIFTNADSIEGFADSFSLSRNDGAKNVWGATFPLERSNDAVALFDEEFDTLYAQLMKRRLARLSAPFAPERQLKIFNFPLHFNSARRKIGAFAAAFFRPHPFGENPLFRGFYFTSNQINLKRGDSLAQTYFGERFFKDVVLRDRNLAATFQAQRQKAPVLGWALTISGAFLTAILLGGASSSLYQNKKLIDEATAKGETVLTISKADKGRDPLKKSASETRAELDALEDLRETLVKLDEYERNGAPLSMRFGLYSGNKLFRDKLLPIYFDAVEQRFKRPSIAKLENDLRKFSADSASLNTANLTDEQEKMLGKNYDLLKAYLMLSGEYKDKAEPTFLTAQLENYWKQNAPSEENLSKQQLEFYAKQIGREAFPRIQNDSKLVEDARRRLQAYPPIFRYYKRITTDVDRQTDAKTVENILAGRSGGTLSGEYTVPGSFTIEGWRGFMKTAIDDAPSEISKDDWVLGASAAKSDAQSTDIAKLSDRYFREYTDHWRSFVRGVKVKPIEKKNDLVETTKTFASTESPLEILVKEVARNTNLSAEPKDTSWIGWLKSFVSKKTDGAKTDVKTSVEKEFEPLFAFVGSDEKPEAAPATKYRTAFNSLYQNVQGLSDDRIKQISKDLAEENDSKLGLQKAENAVNTQLEAFSTAAAQDVADLLKQPFGAIRKFFGADIEQQVDKAWREQILTKAQEIEKGFPFTTDGEADLPKLTAFLNPVNGTLKKFYDERLDKYLEESNGQIRVKESSELKFSDEFIAYLNNAFRLRDALFGKNATAGFEYEVKLAPVKNNIVEMTIDGQKITSEGTSSTKFKFPAATGAETGAFINLTANETSVATAPMNVATPTPNANTNSASNSNTANAPVITNTPAPVSTPTTQTATSAKFAGQWGLWRMLDAANAQKGANGDYEMKLKIGANSVGATFKPSGGDLFDKTAFRMLKAPNEILKK